MIFQKRECHCWFAGESARHINDNVLIRGQLVFQDNLPVVALRPILATAISPFRSMQNCETSDARIWQKKAKKKGGGTF
eukprot:scaffold421367_cov62-Attheya_sp.AAC.4